MSTTAPGTARPPASTTVREPDIYERGGRFGFLRDVMAVAGAPVYGVNVRDAEERLRRHTEYENKRLAERAVGAHHRLGEQGVVARTASGVSTRALSTVSGAGGEVVPPAWMTEHFASVARATCPLKTLVTRVDLPPDTLELHIPRFDTSAGVVPMQLENINPPDEYSQTDATVTKVATFAGDALISQEQFDRGGNFSEEIVANDFAENYGQALASQMMTGTGTNGQVLGLLNVTTSTVNGVPGARLVSYTDASPTPTKVVQAVAQCAAEVSDTRERAPSAVLCRGARYFWIAGTPDGSTNEPVMRPGTGNVPDDSDVGPFGPIAGLPWFLDNTIPVNLGAGTNQDAIAVVRARDILLLEDPAGPRYTAQVGSDVAGQLAVVLQWHHYTAVIPNRYPSAIGTVQGTGLVIPSGF